MRRVWVSMIGILAGIMILGGIMGATKMSSTTTCSSQPSKITLATMRLCDVKWAPLRDGWVAGGSIDDLRGKKVIAILISYPLGPGPTEWDTSFIIVDPELIQKVVSALARADRLQDGETTAISKLQFVFDDNTGVRIDFEKHPDFPYYYGINWVSRDLWFVFEEMFGKKNLP